MSPGKFYASEDSETYLIEKIEDHRKGQDGKLEYLVKWQGYDSDANTWEPSESFVSSIVIRDYHRSVNIPFNMDGSDDELTQIQTIPDSVAEERNFLLERDIVLEKEIKANKLTPERVLKVFHLIKNEKQLVAYTKFKQLDEPKYVHASRANENCPQLVIKFYESKIFWRDRETNKITKYANDA